MTQFANIRQCHALLQCHVQVFPRYLSYAFAFTWIIETFYSNKHKKPSLTLFRSVLASKANLKMINSLQSLLDLTTDIYIASSSSSAFDVMTVPKSSGRWLLGSPPSAVVRQLAPRAWCPLQCLLAKTVGVLSPGVGRSEECAQGFAPQSHIHSGLNQQDLVSLDVFLAHSDQYADGRWWFGSSCQGC